MASAGAGAGAGAVTETVTETVIDADAVTITDAVTVTEAGALAFSFLVEAPASSALSVQETVLKENTEGVEEEKGETSVSIPATDIYRVSSRKSYIYYQLIHHLGLVLCFVALLLQTILFVTFL
jgi:hypothetical protein